MVLIFNFFLFVGFFNQASALECYKCDPIQKICSYSILRFLFKTVNCTENYGGSTISDKRTDDKCVILTVQDQNGANFLGRGCMLSNETCEGVAKRMPGIKENQTESIDCSTCEEDKCNSPLPLLFTVGIVGVCIVLLLILECFCCKGACILCALRCGLRCICGFRR